MKLEKELIKHIENADAYYIVAVKGDTNITSCQAKDGSILTATHLISSALLGIVHSAVIEKKTVNSIPIIFTIVESIKRFPQLLKYK